MSLWMATAPFRYFSPPSLCEGCFLLFRPFEGVTVQSQGDEVCHVRHHILASVIAIHVRLCLGIIPLTSRLYQVSRCV